MNGCEHCNGSGWVPTCACTPGSSVNFSECPHDPVPCPECNRGSVVCPHAPEPCDDCVDRDRAEAAQAAEDRAEAWAWAKGEHGFVDVLSDDDEHHDVWGSRGIGTREEMEAEGFAW